MDDLLPARRHVGGGQRRAVVELDALADLEGVGLAVVGRRRHRGAQIADEIGGRGRIVGIDPDQHAVERRRRMHGREGGLAMAVEARRRVGRDHVGQRAAALRRVGGRRRAGRAQRRQRAAPRPAAANPDVLIIASLRCCWSGSFSDAARSGRRKRSARSNLTHLAAGHPVAGSHLAQLRADLAAALDRDRAARMKHAARRRVDRARHLALRPVGTLRPASTLGSGTGTASSSAWV